MANKGGGGGRDATGGKAAREKKMKADDGPIAVNPDRDKKPTAPRKPAPGVPVPRRG